MPKMATGIHICGDPGLETPSSNAPQNGQTKPTTMLAPYFPDAFRHSSSQGLCIWPSADAQGCKLAKVMDMSTRHLEPYDDPMRHHDR